MSTTLKAEKLLTIRFSEVDSMNVVWHGTYPLYLEDAREYFGALYGLDYMTIYNNGYFAPIVELNIKYHKPLRYGMLPKVVITYQPTEAAKIIFDYEIIDTTTNEKTLTATSVQIFTDKKQILMWDNPTFYTEWKKAHNLI